MTMKLSILVTSNGKQAKADVAEIEAAIGKLGKSAKVTSIETQGAAKSTGTLGTAAGQAEAKVDVLTRAQAQQAATAMRMSQANNLSAGSLGNIAAQFNDIGVMLAAGQNPLQLALQQGTQLNQVLGPLGIRGSLTALRGALVSMVNPISLITLGTIAAGAATVQWLTGAGDDAQAFADRIDELRGALDAYEKSANLSLLTTKQLEERFGSAAQGIGLTIARLEQISRNEAQRTIDGIANSLAELMSIRGDGDQRLGVAEFFDVNIGLAFTQQQREARDLARGLTSEFVNQQTALRNAAGDLDTQISIMLDLIATTEALALAKGGVSAAEEQVLREMNETLLLMQEQKGQIEEVTNSTFNLADAAAAAADGFAAQMPLVRSLIGDVRALAKAAWDYAGALGQSAEKGRGGAVDPRTVGGRGIDWQTRDAGEFLANYKPPKAPRASGGGGGGSARTRIDEVQRLTDRLQDQLDVLRATDPIQKELIRNRKALSKATDEQKTAITDLITQHYEEQKALERKQELWGTIEGIAGSAISGLTDRTKSLNDVLKDTAANLFGLLSQSAITGKGVFGGLFGGVGIGELLFPQKKAEGGMIYGQGGGRDDKVPLWGSAGEFMVNARATARHRALLERINAGMPVQRLAAGGVVGSSIMRPAQNANAAPVMHNHFDLRGARGNQEIMEAVREGMELALETFSREELPGRFAEISENPRMVG